MKMTTRGITSADLYELKSVANPQLSPDGRSYVYVQTTIDQEADEYQSHIYFGKIADGSVPVQWTFGKGKNHSPRWSPDGKRLAFVSNRSGKSQIHILRVNGGEAQQLTSLSCGASNPVWSPDGTRLAFQVSLQAGKTVLDEDKENKQEKPKPLEVSVMQYKSDSEGFWQGTYKQIAVVEVETGEVTQLTAGNYHHTLYDWSPDGTRLAVGADYSQQPDFSFNQDVYLLEVETKVLSPVTKGAGYFGQAVWSPDGSYLGLLGHEREFENATLAKIWLYGTETHELTCLTESWDVPVGSYLVGDFQQGAALPGLIWANDSKGFYFIASDKGNTNIYFGDVNGNVQGVTTSHQHIYGLSVHPDSNQAIAAISTPVEVGDLYLLSLQDGQIVERLTQANKEFLQTIELSEPEAIGFQGAEGWDVYGWLMKPVGYKEGEKYPLILEIHGGPHMMYGNTFMNEFQILAAKGNAVLYINPRGSHGYGQTFVDAVRGDYGGNDYRDLMLAVDYVLENYDFIDETRLGVTGGSYGGFMTNWIVSQTNRFKAAVTQRSISNWISFYGVSDIGYYFTEWQIKSDLADIDTLWKHSPLAYVSNVETPLLILHSEKDYRCPIEQGEQLFIALKRLGKETKFVRFPDENHELSRSGRPLLRKNRLDYITGWFNEYI
jgi:dipeptidyl aminopeptidase/acylaminoacyl peptidase